MLDVNHDGNVFEVSGSLDDDGGRRLLRALATCDGDVRIDGSGLDRIDGAGLTALVLAQRACREQGRRFELLVVAPEALVGLRTADRFAALFGPRPAPATPAASRTPAPVPAMAARDSRRHRRRRWSRAE